MMSKTHVAFSLLVCLIVLDFAAIDEPLLFFAFLLLGTLLPDIDLPTSYLGKRLWFFSWPISFFSKHRGVFHSPLFGGLIFFLLLFLGAPFAVSLGFLCGFASHLFIDALTPAGIALLYPFFPFKVRGFVRTGSLLEFFFFMGILGLIMLVIYHAVLQELAVF